MTEPRRLSHDVLVSGQVTLDDIFLAADGCVVRIINNRPDGEERGQLTSAEIEAAARSVGIDYLHAPIVGLPGSAEVALVAETLARGGETWMYCRSGMRSAAAWAMAMVGSGAMESDEVRDAAAAAGYDLSRLPL